MFCSNSSKSLIPSCSVFCVHNNSNDSNRNELFQDHLFLLQYLYIFTFGVCYSALVSSSFLSVILSLQISTFKVGNRLIDHAGVPSSTKMSARLLICLTFVTQTRNGVAQTIMISLKCNGRATQLGILIPDFMMQE